MKPLKLKISQEAKNDLERIWLYTLSKWSKAHADRYYAWIIEHIHFLRTHPQTGKIAEHIRSGYRVSLVKNHVIFYRLIQNQTLEVTRILHQQMDITKWIDRG